MFSGRGVLEFRIVSGMERRKVPVAVVVLAVVVFSRYAIADVNSPAVGSSDLLEFCLADTFNATCSHGQVLLMTSAQFGRMRKGRCVKGDYGVMGCAVDALTDMDSMCSGTRECQFRIFDSKLRLKSVCPEDMTSYLEARYQCVEVVNTIGGQCEGQRRVIVTQPSGYLASVVSEDHGLGTGDCPWVIRASPGQKVTLNLRYFGTENRAPEGRPVDDSDGGQPEAACYDLLTFREPGGEYYTVSTCHALPKGEREVYRSESHEVQVQLVGRMQLRTLGRFIVRFQVTGCADMPPPFNATVRRDKDKIIVKCDNSEHTWYLVCRNSTWLGDTVNCNQVVAASAWNITPLFGSSSFPFGILLVVALGVALGIFCGGLLLTCVVVYMKRQRRTHEAMDECTDFRNFDGYEGHVTGDLTELGTADDDLSQQQTTKVIHPYTTKHYVVGGQQQQHQEPSSGIGSLDHVTGDYDRQFASMKAAATTCPERCCYPSMISKNHLYEIPHAV